QRSPPPTTITQVITRRAATATSAPIPSLRDRSHRHHRRLRPLIEVDTLNDRPRQPARALPYALVSHPALPPGSKSLDNSEPRNRAGCTRGPSDNHPRIKQKSEICMCAGRGSGPTLARVLSAP